MNRKQVITLAALAFAGATAMAQEASPDHFAQSVAGQSRAAVRAEVDQARADGRLQQTGGEATVFAERQDPASVKTREEVRAEARASARRTGFDDYNIGA